MSQKNIMMILLVLVTLGFGMMYVELKNSIKFKNDVVEGNIKNWGWEDRWDSTPISNSEVVPSAEPVAPVEVEQPKVAITASTYNEAIQKSSELGRPVLAFFTANWCGYCVKMKAETLSSPEVASVLKNYILVYVDADTNREVIRKHNVSGLPSYAILNSKEEKLKFGSGIMSPTAFSEWLNEPSLFDQPKGIVAPDNQPIERDRRIMLRR